MAVGRQLALHGPNPKGSHQGRYSDVEASRAVRSIFFKVRVFFSSRCQPSIGLFRIGKIVTPAETIALFVGYTNSMCVDLQGQKRVGLARA